MESVLSAGQSANLPEIEFRRKLVDASFTPEIVRQLGLGERQVRGIKTADREVRLAIWKVRCEFNDKLYASLTPAHQERISDECDRGKLPAIRFSSGGLLGTFGQ